MNLLEIRTQFVKLSGRYDLVDALFADTGADYYLKSGIKFLDRRVEFDKDVGKFFKQMAIGGYFVEFSNYRTTDSVWFATAEGRRELVYLSPADMQNNYGTVPYGDNIPGAPIYYTMAITRSIPDGSAPDVIGNYAAEIVGDESQLDKQGILIYPPTDTAGQIEVWGKYATPWPSLDTGTNFWFDSFEHVAILAALYQLETSYRNTAGQKDLLASITEELVGIEKDTVEDDAGRAEEMEG